MGRVFVDLSISMDGLITGPNPRPGLALGEGGQQLHHWMFPPSGDPNPGDREVYENLFSTCGAIVMGRRSFAVVEEIWGENPLFHHLPVFVLTHDARETITKGGTTYTFVTDGVESILAQARAAAGDKNVCLLGASIAQQCLQAGLLDGIHLHLVPILLGQGTRLFDQLGNKQIALERMELIGSKGATHLRLRVIK